MPLYTYKCRVSGETFDRIAPMAASADPRICACGAVGDRVISPTRINKDYEDYTCPVTGKLISGRVAHEENLKRTGSRVFEPGEKDAMMRRKAAEEAAFDKKIEDSVEQAIDALPSAKREALANEMTAGVTAEVVRL